MIVIKDQARQYWNGSEFQPTFEDAKVYWSATAAYAALRSARKIDSLSSISSLTPDQWQLASSKLWP